MMPDAAKNKRPKTKTKTAKPSPENPAFIGYRDLYGYIQDVLQPFLNPAEVADWGIAKPAGIILYGPPGSGKIFWAKKIADLLNFQFREVKKNYFGTSFVDGKRTGFNDFLIQMMKEDKVLLFMEDFDDIMKARNPETSVTSQNEETKAIVLHYVDKFIKENLLMVGSAINLAAIDEEITAPGRFDVAIPVFPPNEAERAEMILYQMTFGLAGDAILTKILKNSGADKPEFWQETAGRMKVFSNTMIVDFTQSLKKRLRSEYLKTKNENLPLEKPLLEAALRDASAKMNGEYLGQAGRFLQDVMQNNPDDFPERVQALRHELDFYRKTDVPRQAIGFQHNAAPDVNKN